MTGNGETFYVFHYDEFGDEQWRTSKPRKCVFSPKWYKDPKGSKFIWPALSREFLQPSSYEDPYTAFSPGQPPTEPGSWFDV